PYFGVVDDDTSLFGDGLGEVDCQTTVVKLSVVVEYSSLQTLRFQIGQVLQGLFARQKFGWRQAQLSRHAIVQLHADAVEWSFPPRVGGNNECQRMHQVGSVSAEQTALLERLQNQ